jgi:hypothetical protein
MTLGFHTGTVGGSGGGGSMAIGGAVTSGTAGSILFIGAGGVLAQDNVDIFWDATNNRQGLLTNAPTHSLTFGSTSTGIALYNTTDQVTNFERGQIFWNTNAFTVSANVGGTGTTRALVLNSQLAGGAFSRITLDRSTSPWMIFSTTGNTGGAVIRYSFQTTGGDNPSSGTSIFAQFLAQYASTGTTAATDILINSVVTSAGSGNQRWLDMQLSGTSWYSFNRGSTATTAAFNSSSAVETAVLFAPVFNQSGTAGYTALRVNATETAIGSGTKLLLDLQVGAASRASIDNNGKHFFQTTDTAGGTTGAQTINKPSGSVNFAAAATSLVVTNSTVTANSYVFAVVKTNDTTAVIKNVVPTAGSFIITLTAAATAETRVAFLVIN